MDALSSAGHPSIAGQAPAKCSAKSRAMQEIALPEFRQVIEQLDSVTY
jgi:hypothetical protein